MNWNASTPFRRRICSGVAAVALCAGGVLSGGGTATAATPTTLAAAASKVRVVAMGDSFGSGEGTFRYLYDKGTNTKTDQCHRSSVSWQRNIELPHGLGVTSYANRKLDYHQVSCSGATTADILWRSRYGEKYQFTALNGKERYVLLSIGGNNIGFSTILTRCLAVTHCQREKSFQEIPAKIDKAEKSIDDVIQAIHNKSKKAIIILTGYPMLITGDECSPFITAGERNGLDTMATLLNKKTAAMAGHLRSHFKIDVRYVDMVKAFGSAHGACSGDSSKWLNGPDDVLDVGKAGLFHPNGKGQAAYMKAVDAAVK